MPKFKWEKIIYQDRSQQNGLVITLVKLSDSYKTNIQGGKLTIKRLIKNKKGSVVYYEAIPNLYQAKRLFISAERFLKENIKRMGTKFWKSIQEHEIKYILKHRN